MASPEVHTPDHLESEPYINWLDLAVICGTLIGGMLLGTYVGELLGGHAAGWLGMGLGGSFLGGLGYYAHCTFRPQVGHPLAAIRIVALLLLTGAYGYFAVRWMGRPGPFIAFVLVPIIVDAVFRGFRIAKFAIRAIRGWHTRKPSQISVTTSLLWDADLDRKPDWPG